jgi:hypothetical protein
MTDEKITATQTLEAIGLNDPTIAALLKELKENAMAKSDAMQSDAEPKANVRRALEAIIIRCTEGDKQVDWLPVIERLAKEAIVALAQSSAERNIEKLKADGWRLPINAAVLAQSDAEPVAWQLVPIDPTAEMCDAGREFFPDGMNENDVYARPVWQAMLAVAPAPPRRDVDAYSAISWSGFNIYGDRKSIDAVRDMMHARDRCEALDKMISEKQLVRPDASAGLIEAAEMAEEFAVECKKAPISAGALRDFAKYLRARAADRNGK